MATRKEKNQKALARRNHFLEELQRSNAIALKREHNRRERENWEAWRDGHDKRHQVLRVEECPLCKAGVGLSRPVKEEA